MKEHNEIFLRLVYIPCFLIAVGTSGAHADENAEANKLFVEAAQIVKKAAAAQLTESIELYEQALQNLDRIVATYPSSTLAVQIVSGQSVGNVSRTAVEQALLKARQAKCSRHLQVLCVLDKALETTRSIEDGLWRVEVLSDITTVQVKVGREAEANAGKVES
jgi:hypothetical protein